MSPLALKPIARIVLALVLAAWSAGHRPAVGAENPKAPTAPKPQEPAPAQRIDKLIRQLGSKDYYSRQQAQDELAKMGFEALEALDAATTNDDLEIASRVKYLLRLMRVEWISASDPESVKACLRNYENLDGQSREIQMRRLASLPSFMGVTALCRLVRFEKSSLLSKTAASILLLRGNEARPPSPAAVATVRKSLEGCNRPGAVWLRAWAELAGDSQAAMLQWAKLVAAETTLLQQTPDESSPEIVERLIRFQVAWLRKLGKNDETQAAIGRLVGLERGDSESVGELLRWLIEQKAWKAIDDLAQRHAPQFAVEPDLLYALAQSYDERGDKQRARETAMRAFHLHPGTLNEQLGHHFMVAQQLCEHGQFAWARREFEHVISTANEAESLSAMARMLLAEMFHEQGQDRDAAAAMEKLVNLMDAGKVPETMFGGRARQIRLKLHYFSACRWAASGDVVKQRACLDKALEIDPEDIDVLIACYRLPDQPAAYRAKIVDSVKKLAEKLHAAVVASPDNATLCNNYAWVVGNTEGDFDDALKCSWKAVELMPEEGGYYDTLAHVYFGKGDFKNAVKYEAKAAKLDPHSGLIQIALERFRKKLAEKKT